MFSSADEGYRLLFECNPQAMYVYDQDTLKFLAVNDAAVQHYGYSREEFLSKSIKDIRPPEDFPAFVKDLARIPARGLDNAGHWRHRKKDGSLIDVEIVSHPLPFGGRRGKLVVAHDITQRKNIEEQLRSAHAELERRVVERTAALRESEARFRAFMENSPVLAFIKDSRSRFVYANEHLAKLFGRKAGELPGMSDFDLVAREAALKFRKNDRAVLATGKTLETIQTVQTSDGRAQTWLSIKFPILNQSGKCFVGAVVVDITTLKRTEQTLRESEDRLQHALTAGRFGAWELDLLSHEAWRSVSHDQIFGYSKSFSKWTYEKFLKHVLPEDRAEVDQKFQRAVSKAAGWEFTCRIRRNDGAVRWIWAQSRVQRDAHKQPVRMVGLVQDITERKELEHEILAIVGREHARIGRDLHDGLCQILTGAKFKSSLLEQKLKTTAPSVAHEAGAIEVLLSQAIDQARNLACGLNPVRLNAGGLSVALKNLAASVGSAFHLQCFCHIPKPVAVRDPVEAEHLYRIAQESIQNAIKHGRPKNISVSLTAHDGEVELAVKDDGVGLPSKLKSRAGTGLHNMNTRAKSIGAALEIRPRKHGGTAVICRLRSPAKQNKL